MKKELGMYELVLLLKLTSTEQDLTEKMEYYKNFLTERGSQITVKNCGKKPLAYPIKGFDTAISIQLIFLGNGELIQQLNTIIKRDQSILRSIVTSIKSDTNLKLKFA